MTQPNVDSHLLSRNWPLQQETPLPPDHLPKKHNIPLQKQLGGRYEYGSHFNEALNHHVCRTFSVVVTPFLLPFLRGPSHPVTKMHCRGRSRNACCLEGVGKQRLGGIDSRRHWRDLLFWECARHTFNSRSPVCFLEESFLSQVPIGYIIFVRRTYLRYFIYFLPFQQFYCQWLVCKTW